MFDEGQELHTPYHRTKFEAEKIVREKVQGAWRVYRPSIVVGNSKTGEMDKIDGPYYFFKVLQKLRTALPQWAPLVSIEWGWTNLVPVDYVAAAIDHIAHEEGLDGQAFHIIDPKGISSGDAINTFARAGHAPHAVMRVDKKLTSMLPKGVLSYAMQIPALKGVRKSVLADLGIPDEILDDIALTPKFDSRDTKRALRGLGDRAARRWTPTPTSCGTTGSATSTRTCSRTARSRAPSTAARWSSPARRAASAAPPRSRSPPRAGSRSWSPARWTSSRSSATRSWPSGGTAYAYSADLSDNDSIDALVETILAEHAVVDMLVNNAGRSIRRSVMLSIDRFHDYERTIKLNYLGTIKLILGLLPHMKERGFGHVVNVSSIGVQTNPPRFSAYVASKAALDAFTRVVSAPRRSATTSRSRRSTCRSCGRR